MKKDSKNKIKGETIIFVIFIALFAGGFLLFYIGQPLYQIEGCLDKFANDYCLDNNFTGVSYYYLGYNSFRCDMEFDRIHGIMSKSFLYSEEEKERCILKERWSLKKKIINELQGGKKG